MYMAYVLAHLRMRIGGEVTDDLMTEQYISIHL